VKITLHHQLKVTATINVWKINERGRLISEEAKGSAEPVYIAQASHFVLQCIEGCHQNDCFGAEKAILDN